MNETLFSELSAWMTQAGLAGTPETDIVSVFCDRCVAAGIPLGRAHVFIDTLHPVYEGRLFRWGYSPSESSVHEYGRTRSEGFDLPRSRISGCTGDRDLAAQSLLHHAANRRVTAAPPPECRHERRVLAAA